MDYIQGLITGILTGSIPFYMLYKQEQSRKKIAQFEGYLYKALLTTSLKHLKEMLKNK